MKLLFLRYKIKSAIRANIDNNFGFIRRNVVNRLSIRAEITTRLQGVFSSAGVLQLPPDHDSTKCRPISLYIADKSLWQFDEASI